MNDRIADAIARSISHNEIVTIEGTPASIAREAEERGWDVDWNETGDVWSTEDQEWRLRVTAPPADQIIGAHFAEWGNTGPTGQYSAIEGFVGWATGVAQETRTQLADDDLDQIASEVAHSVEQAARIGESARVVTEEEAAEWLRDNREELIEAIDEELAGK